MENFYMKFLKVNTNFGKDNLDEYKKLVHKCIITKNYIRAINIYEHMFEQTKDMLFKIYIADIVLKCLNNPKKSLEIYRQLEPYMKEDLVFLYGISDVFWVLRDYYNQVLYLSKALNIQRKVSNA